MLCLRCVLPPMNPYFLACLPLSNRGSPQVPLADKQYTVASIIVFVRTHPNLGVPLVQSHKFATYHGWLPIAHVRYVKILTWLRGFKVKIAIGHKENQSKYRQMTGQPRSHVRILIYQTWAIGRPTCLISKWRTHIRNQWLPIVLTNTCIAETREARGRPMKCQRWNWWGGGGGIGVNCVPWKGRFQHWL